MSVYYTLFETAVGACAIAWSERGVRTILLPDTTPAATERAMHHRFPDAERGAPPPAIAEATEAIRAHLAGEPAALDAIALDDAALEEFARAVYAEARRIPSGETRTYGELATALGKPGAARAVGQALGRNPFPIVVPCHRVLAQGGRSGGFTAPGGLDTKARLLAIEGADVPWTHPAQRELF